jgi:small subunit ribosomal protein S27e
MLNIRKSNSKFLKVSCPRCKNQQIVYGKATTKVKCNSCNYPLTKNTGGKARIRALIRRVIWK